MNFELTIHFFSYIAFISFLFLLIFRKSRQTIFMQINIFMNLLIMSTIIFFILSKLVPMFISNLLILTLLFLMLLKIYTLLPLYQSSIIYYFKVAFLLFFQFLLIFIPFIIYLRKNGLTQAVLFYPFLNGDNRNHVQYINTLIQNDLPSSFYLSPFFNSAFGAYLYKIFNNDEVLPTLVELLVIQTALYLLCLMFVAFSISALIEVHIPKTYVNKLYTCILISFGFLLVYTNSILSISLQEGHLTGLWAAGALMSYISFHKNVQISSGRHVLMLLIIILNCILIYTPLILFFILHSIFYLFIKFNNLFRINKIALFSSFLIVFLFLLIFSSLFLSNLVKLFQDTGSINPPHFYWILILASTYIIVWSLKFDFNDIFFQVSIFIFILAFFSYFVNQRSDYPFGYYTVKLGWIILLPMVIIISIRLCLLFFDKISLNFLIHVILVSFSFLSLIAPNQNYLVSVYNATKEGPNMQVTLNILEASNQQDLREEIVVFFNKSDPGNDRIGNFWLAIFSEPNYPYSPYWGWAYRNDTSKTEAVCELFSYYNSEFIKFHILSSDKSVARQELDKCKYKLNVSFD
jgi:hypothetical protein